VNMPGDDLLPDLVFVVDGPAPLTAADFLL
jgi:hypothetical protein